MHIASPVPSKLVNVHDTTNPALRAALEALPGWRSATRAWDLLVSSARDLDPPEVTVDGLADELYAGLRDGKPLPTDLARNVAALDAAGRGWPRTHQMLMDLAGRISAERDAAFITGAEAICKHLHGQLLAAVDVAVGSLDDLGDIRAPLAAAQAGQWEAWAAFEKASEDVAAVRTAQRLVADRVWWSGGQGRDPRWDDASVIANVLDVFPDYGRFKSHGFHEDPDGAQTVIHDPRPEPGGVEHLMWLVTSAADPWVPTQDQYEAAAAELTAAVRAARHADPAAPVDPHRVARARARTY